MTLHVAHGGADATSRGLSASLWGKCPVIQFPYCGYMLYDDFMTTDNTVSAAGTFKSEGGIYEFVEQNAGTVAPLLTGGPGGHIALSSSTSDNDAAMITSYGNAFIIRADTATGDKRDLWFECRVARTSVTDGDGGFFVGLTEESAQPDGLIADAGTMATGANAIDFIGFMQLDADGNSVDFVYCDENGTSQQAIDGAATIVASTYIKLGFHYTPAGGGGRFTIYVNGEPHATQLAGSTTTNANFPAGEELCMTACVKTDDTTASVLNMDWWACAQLNES